MLLINIENLHSYTDERFLHCNRRIISLNYLGFSSGPTSAGDNCEENMLKDLNKFRVAIIDLRIKLSVLVPLLTAFFFHYFI